MADILLFIFINKIKELKYYIHVVSYVFSHRRKDREERGNGLQQGQGIGDRQSRPGRTDAAVLDGQKTLFLEPGHNL